MRTLIALRHHGDALLTGGQTERRCESHLLKRSRCEKSTSAPRFTVMFRVATWNLEWATRRAPRGMLLRERLNAMAADVLCITESSAGMLPDSGYYISSDSDYGYPGSPDRRKVLLWSPEPWTDVDDHGSDSMPGGRFVAGTTNSPFGPVRIIGVCIPWKDAHVRSGRRDRQPWQDRS